MTLRKKVGVISLGCDKNRVDTEKMLFELQKQHELTDNVFDAQVIVINTCAFIESARKEAIDEIMNASQLKNSKLEKLIVSGCFPQRFNEEAFPLLTEVDAFLGVNDYDKINQVIDMLYEKGQRIDAVGTGCIQTDFMQGRVLSTDNYAYLKIADGCDNHCTYCLIPSIRGKFRSVPYEMLIEQAKNLGKIEELILVAQDVTKYGCDLQPKSSLPQLIRGLSALDNISGIRILYCYPENITDELIRELSGNAKMIRYIDIPLQHASNRILKLMNRKGSFDDNLALIEKLKREVNGIAIRSTFIAGFPTETQEDFEILVDFIKRAKLFNCGFFGYSLEEGTASFNLDGRVDKKTINQRVKKLYSVQKQIVKENLKGLVGGIFNVVAEGFDQNLLMYYGRAYFNAPQIDGKVYFFSDKEIIYGKRYNIKIKKYQGYDLLGERL